MPNTTEFRVVQTDDPARFQIESEEEGIVEDDFDSYESADARIGQLLDCHAIELPNRVRVELAKDGSEIRVFALESQERTLLIAVPMVAQHLGKDPQTWIWEFCDCIRQRGDITVDGAKAPKGQGEFWIDLPGGRLLRYPSKQIGRAEYVRITRPGGTELVYWDQQEFADDPEGVMGALFGAMAGSGT